MNISVNSSYFYEYAFAALSDKIVRSIDQQEQTFSKHCSIHTIAAIWYYLWKVNNFCLKNEIFDNNRSNKVTVYKTQIGNNHNAKLVEAHNSS